MKKENLSPLYYYTQKQSQKISESLSNDKLIIDFAMRYGNPSIRSKIKKLHNEGLHYAIFLFYS